MFRTRSVKIKLLLGFSVVILLFCAAIAYSVYFMSGIQSLTAEQTRRVSDQMVVQDLKNEAGLLHGYQANVMMKQNDAAAEEVTKHAALFRSLVDKAAGTAETAEQKKWGEQLKSAAEGYLSDVDRVMAVFHKRTSLSNQEKNDQFMTLSDDSEIYKQMIYAPLDRLAASYTKEYEKSKTDLLSQIKGTIRISIIVSSATVILAIAISLLMGRWMGRPLLVLAGAAGRIAQGDLRGEIAVRASNDEIGMLTESFGIMVSNLKALLREVDASSKQVASSSQELSSSAVQSAQGSQHVAAAIAEVAAGAETQGQAASETVRVMEEMAAGVQKIAESSTSIAEVSVDTAAKAQAGNESIHRVVRQMSEIKSSVDHQVTVVSRLESNSQEIGSIVGTMMEIAGRTNILALNAGIESARAGEQGKGFAIVATEVRKLAEQSSSSARQVAGLVDAIQEDIREAVNAMNTGSEQVRLGMERTEETGVTFQQILHAIDRVVNQIQEMSAVTEQMSASSEEVTASMTELSGIAKQTARASHNVSASTQEQLAIMEEVAASSAQLNGLAQNMQSVIEKFKI